jgi:hypothetical protein
MKLTRRFNGGKVEAKNRVPARGRLNLRRAARQILDRLEFASSQPTTDGVSGEGTNLLAPKTVYKTNGLQRGFFSPCSCIQLNQFGVHQH